jgi:hypothetical protein
VPKTRETATGSVDQNPISMVSVEGENPLDGPDHLGHRKRLRARWDSAGGKGFADYELLELLLTYIFARCDTKPLAKRLLDQFGSFKGARVQSAIAPSGYEDLR